MIHSIVKSPLLLRRDVHVWWNRGKGTSSAVGFSRASLYLATAPTHHLLPHHQHPPSSQDGPDIQHPFPTSSLKPNWQPENPWALGCIFPVVLFRLYLHFMISHLERKTERAIFFPSALQGVEQILNSTKWSCQGLKSFSGSNCLSVCSEEWRG